jgi:hypothetical protein
VCRREGYVYRDTHTCTPHSWRGVILTCVCVCVWHGVGWAGCEGARGGGCAIAAPANCPARQAGMALLNLHAACVCAPHLDAPRASHAAHILHVSPFLH